MEGTDWVVQAHDNFIQAGAQVVTTNSYALVPFHIGEERFAEQGRDLAAQLGPGHFLALAAFVVGDDGWHARRMGRGNMAKHLLRVIHLCAHKPTRTRHDIALQHRGVRRG